MKRVRGEGGRFHSIKNEPTDFMVKQESEVSAVVFIWYVHTLETVSTIHFLGKPLIRWVQMGLGSSQLKASGLRERKRVVLAGSELTPDNQS